MTVVDADKSFTAMLLPAPCTGTQPDTGRHHRRHREALLLLVVVMVVGLLALGVAGVWVEVRRSAQIRELTQEVDRLKHQVEDLRLQFAELDNYDDEEFDDEEPDDEVEKVYEKLMAMPGEDPETSTASSHHQEGHVRLRRSVDSSSGYQNEQQYWKVQEGSSLPRTPHRNRTSNSEGLRLYESLVASKGQGEPRDAEVSWDEAVTESGIRPHHRAQIMWPKKPWERRKTTTQGTPAIYDDEQYIYRSSPSSSTPPPVLKRRSRVQMTDYPEGSRPHQRPPQPHRVRHQTTTPPTGHGEILVRVYQPQEQGATATAPAPQSKLTRSGPGAGGGGRRLRKGRGHRRNKNKGNLDSEFANPGIVLAAHFIGDTSGYTINHRDYEGNGRLRNSGGIFTSWSASPWMSDMGVHPHFQLQNGTVTVREPGLYYVYAQINYVDEHEVNGFKVYARDEPLLQCTSMGETHHGQRNKVNTCYTAGVTFLKAGDQVYIRDVEAMRYSIFLPEKSFFGLFRIAHSRPARTDKPLLKEEVTPRSVSGHGSSKYQQVWN